jgi:predicted secreted acid phosphatase
MQHFSVASSVEAAFLHATQLVVVKRRMVCKPAIVLDIDDTALIGPDDSQYTHKPVHKFYKTVVALGVHVFFVTARSEKEPGNREETLAQLKECGYSKFDKLLMAPRYTSAFTEIKKSHRDAIRKAGYDILVNSGDQWADLVSEKVPETILHRAELVAKGKTATCKPILFYNGPENDVLCIKLKSRD